MSKSNMPPSRCMYDVSYVEGLMPRGVELSVLKGGGLMLRAWMTFSRLHEG